MKKKLLISLLAIVMCFTLAGCNKDNGGTKTNGEYQGSVESGDGLNNVTDKNYKEIAKKIFGIDIKDNSGWTLVKVESPNKVNNLNINWTVSNGKDAKGIMEHYFNVCKEVSTDGIYSQGMNESYTAVVKKDKYDDFASYYEKEATKMNDFYQVKWIYDNNGKNVQFYITIEDDKANASFVLLG